MQLYRWALLATLGATLPALAQITDETPVIEASGLTFTKAEFEELVKGDGRYKGAAGTSAGRRALAQDFAKAFALEAEARRRKLDQTPSMKLKLRHNAQQMLAYELLLTLRKEYGADEARLTAEYEKNKDFYAQPRVRQILVRAKGSDIAIRAGQRELSVEAARTKAVALRAKLVAGADFATLAGAESDDLGSRERGGDMGPVQRGATREAFEAAAFTLPIGQISDVIQTSQGFHILRVEERRHLPLAEVKQVIANDLAHREMDRLTTGSAKINESYFQP
jgi:parvulin-like peptidyl-prolyl isomerase